MYVPGFRHIYYGTVATLSYAPHRSCTRFVVRVLGDGYNAGSTIEQSLVYSKGNAVDKRIGRMPVIDHIAVWLIQNLVCRQREDEALPVQEVCLVLLRRLVADAGQVVLVATVVVVKAKRLPKRRREVLLQAGRAKLGNQRLVSVVLVHIGLARGVHVAHVDAAVLVAYGVGQGHVGLTKGDGALGGAECESALVSAGWTAVCERVGDDSANERRRQEHSLVLGIHVKTMVSDGFFGTGKLCFESGLYC
jgi:hypothetical protein